jgi:hypothetical protein
MNLFLLWMRRKAPITLLLILLLTVGTAFGSVGVSAYLTANRQTETAAGAYTTIAVPYDPEWLGRTPVESFELREDYSAPCRYYDLDALLGDAPMTVQACPAVPLQGIIPDSKPVKASDFDTKFSFYGMPEAQYECGVAAIRCDSVTDCSEERIYYGFQGGEMAETWTERIKQYQYRCTLVEPLSIPEPSKNQEAIQTSLLVDTKICTEDGSPIFERGKTYLIWARFSLVPYFTDEDSAADQVTLVAPYCNSKENYAGSSKTAKWAVSAENAPLAAAYTGSVEEFLNSEEGKLWKELIAQADRNHQSVKLLATDAVESLVPFCVREDEILEGRMYTSEEARSGVKVCIVPALWAEKNGVKVGDVLPISIYAPQYDVMQYIGHSEDDIPGPGFFPPKTDQAQIWMWPSYPEDDTGQGGDYEVVGIYTCPPPQSGSLHFEPDTVLIPKSSIKHAEQYRTEDMKHDPLLNPYLLENGAQDALEGWLSEQGLRGNFLYYDYGYSVAEEAIDRMTDNGAQLLWAGVGAFLLALLLFTLLLRLLLAKSVRTARLLGQVPKAIRRSFAKTIPFWAVPAVLLGGIMSRIGYGFVTEKLLSAALTFDYRIAGLVAAAELIVICAALWIVGARTSKVRLMRGGRR